MAFKSYLPRAGTSEGILAGIFNKIGNALSNAVSSFKDELINKLGIGFLFGAEQNKSDIYLKDPRHAKSAFGLDTSYYVHNYPRLSFNYYVRIKYNVNDYVNLFLNEHERQMLVPLVKSVQLPGMKIKTEKINQYNRWVLAQTKIEYDDIVLEMHDTVDGKTLRFWEMYQEYYFKDALDYSPDVWEKVEKEQMLEFIETAASNLQDQQAELATHSWYELYDKSVIEKKIADTQKQINGFLDDYVSLNDEYIRKIDSVGELRPQQKKVYTDNFGYNLANVKEQPNLIHSIEIYQVHGGRWSKVVLINPRITQFQHGTLDYSKSDLMSLKFTIAYEYALYHNFSTLFTDDDYTGAKVIYRNAQNMELSKHTQDPGELQIRNRSDTENPSDPTEILMKQRRTGILGNVLDKVDALVADAPNQIGDAVANGVLTGNFKSPYKDRDISKEIFGGVGNATQTGKASIAGNFASNVVSGVVPGGVNR